MRSDFVDQLPAPVMKSKKICALLKMLAFLVVVVLYINISSSAVLPIYTHICIYIHNVFLQTTAVAI